MVPDNLAYVSKERQWLLLDTKGSKKCAFLSIYMACQSSNSDHFIQWNEDLLSIVTPEAINSRDRGSWFSPWGTTTPGLAESLA